MVTYTAAHTQHGPAGSKQCQSHVIVPFCNNIILQQRLTDTLNRHQRPSNNGGQKSGT